MSLIDITYMITLLRKTIDNHVNNHMTLGNEIR